MYFVAPRHVESSQFRDQTPALAGRFLTTKPPGKPLPLAFKCEWIDLLIVFPTRVVYWIFYRAGPFRIVFPSGVLLNTNVIYDVY